MKFFFSQRGGSIVEFALVLPFLILTLFGIIEFGILMYNQQVITNAAREGVRMGIVEATVTSRTTVAQIQSRVHDYADLYLVSFAAPKPAPTINVTRDNVSGCCTANGQNLAVQVSYVYTFPVLHYFIPSLSSFTLRSTATMRCE